MTQVYGALTGMGDAWRDELKAILEREDPEALIRVTRKQTAKVVRYLNGRLCSADDKERWRAVRALGVVVGEAQLVSRQKAADLLRRFHWALNDESGAVPYGVPEAIGEILGVRSELQGDFLPILCAMLTDEDMKQTGSIERGVMWALGRIGPPVARCSPAAVEALRWAAKRHTDPETRGVAARSLALILATK